jgi:hypothetical protein
MRGQSGRDEAEAFVCQIINYGFPFK